MKLRFIYRAWKARLRDQQLEIEIARAFIRPGDLVVDAGANKGAYLYWMRQCAGPDGKVLAYEPQPELAKYLTAVREAFAWKNVEVHPVALSDRVGQATLHVPGSGVSPGASLESSVLEHDKGRRFECSVDTLEHQLADRGNIRFCKVDVEGHELSLFRGGAQTLERDRPVLLFECEARHLTKHSMGDVFAFLKELGYAGYLLRGHELLPVEKCDAAIHQRPGTPGFWNAPDYYNNFLFLAGSLPESLKRKLTVQK